MLAAEGSDVDINATLTKTRLYQNFTDAATARGFYDAKNARLCSCIGLRIWLVPYAMSNDCMKRSMSGQGLTHREPALDEDDFERYVKSRFPLMLPGRDVLWVLGGRTDTNRGKCCTFATT